LAGRLELSTFVPSVGDAFVIEAAEGPRVELTLTDAATGPWQPEGESAFAFELIFRGPPDPVLPQATYLMTHPVLGSLEIFIVPIERDASGSTYQAVFS
jgi:hypothetical protein